MKTVWTNFRRAFGDFCKSRRGNVALTFGIAVIPVMGMVGAAIDYGRANAVKASLQAALDSTSLMISKDAATLTDDQLHDKALTYFKALFVRPEATNVNLTKWTYDTTGGSKVELEVTADVPTTFVRILSSLETITVKGSSTAKWGTSRLRVALVLDNTGSMLQDGKLDALKTATKNLLTQLQGAVSVAGDVYVSIVPFVKDVKVDPTGYNASWDNWLYWDDAAHTDDKSWDGANGTCTVSGSPRSVCQSSGICSLGADYNNQSTCTAATGSCSISGKGYTTQSTCTSNGVCSKKQYTSQLQCTTHSGTWTVGVWTSGTGTWTAGVWTPKAHSTWNGCISDRGNNWYPTPPTTNYDQNVTAPTSSIPATMFPAEQYSSCPEAITGLNYDWTAMSSSVDSMVAAGNTNQGIGLVWGWHTLTGVGPFTAPAFDANYQYQQAIILLSDGMNTEDRWYKVQGSIDNRMWDSATGNGTCANIKAANITIYAIQVNTGGDPTSTVMQNCASGTDHFFMLTAADEIVTTFQKIGTDLTKLRVAQ